MVDAAGHKDYSHVALLLMLAHARGKVNLREDLSMESVILDFSRSLLLKSVQKLGSLEPIQNLLMCLSSLPLSAGTLEFTDQQLKIVGTELVSHAFTVRTWLSS